MPEIVNGIRIYKNSDHTDVRYGRLVGVKPIGSLHTTHCRKMVWLWKCDCGNYIERYADLVKSGRTNSCGCLKRELNQKPTGEASFNKLLSSYKNGARHRNLSFALTAEQFRIITKLNCAYCGIEPIQTIKGKRSNGKYIFNGVDRIDNTRGYEIGNCVACCTVCNKAKSSLPYKDFINWIKRIVNNNTEWLEVSHASR